MEGSKKVFSSHKGSVIGRCLICGRNLLVYLLNVSFFAVHEMEACLFLSMLSEFKNSIINCFQRLVIGCNATIFLEVQMLK